MPVEEEPVEEEPVEEEPDEEEPVEEEPVLNKTYFSSAKKKALLIGINYNEDHYKDDDLNGCVNDLNNLKEFLKDLDFKREDIVTLTNGEATKERIQDEILNLSSFSHENPGSNIWLSYSGHGAQIDTLFNSEVKCEIICPSDYMYNGVIKDFTQSIIGFDLYNIDGNIISFDNIENEIFSIKKKDDFELISRDENISFKDFKNSLKS